MCLCRVLFLSAGLGPVPESPTSPSTPSRLSTRRMSGKCLSSSSSMFTSKCIEPLQKPRPTFPPSLSLSLSLAWHRSLSKSLKLIVVMIKFSFQCGDFRFVISLVLYLELKKTFWKICILRLRTLLSIERELELHALIKPSSPFSPPLGSCCMVSL